MNLHFTARALNDLDEIYDFIANDSPVFAKKLTDELLAFSRGLAKFPDSGRLSVLPDGTFIRERIHGNYRVFYHLVDDALEIITIRHMARLSE
jgi:toxin ParE1/3/4